MKLQRFMGTAAVLLASIAAAAGSCIPSGAATTPAAPPVTTALTAPALSMDEAVRMTEDRFHARVVKAETLRDNGHVVYVLRLLDEAGRVWTVRVDAASGALSQ
jgi:uncharacterized membrane protein YkoI